MNKTIAQKMFRWSITLVVVILVTALLGVQFFAESIYRQNTQDILKGEIKEIEKEIIKGDVDAAVAAMDNSAFRLGGVVSLYDDSGNLLYNSYQGGQGAGRGRGYGGFGSGSGNTYNDIEENQIVAVASATGKESLLYKVGLDGGGVLLIQMPFEKLTDALKVFKQLLLYVAIMAIVVAIFGSAWLSSHFSKPIIALRNLADEITRLDFGGLYDGQDVDEIGQLGISLNRLSKALKETIEQLQLELDKEKTMDSLRTQFIAQASHELQTPLTVIRNYIEALEDGLVTDTEMSEHYRIMTEEVDGMSELVTGLLDLSQLRSGHFTIRMEDFDIVEFLKGEATIFKERGRVLELVVDAEIEEGSIFVKGDPKRLRQVVRNFYENAFKHSNGHVSLVASIEDGFYKVSVENTGAPIEAADLDVLWEVFYKEEGNYKKGLGLGLAINKEILEKHGATYGIENTKQGVRSHFELSINK